MVRKSAIIQSKVQNERFDLNPPVVRQEIGKNGGTSNDYYLLSYEHDEEEFKPDDPAQMIKQ